MSLPLPNTRFSRNPESGIRGAYWYGYQGSEIERQDFFIYSTYFRELNSAIGTWTSLDPKMSAWESPYASMNNAPIRKNDVKGDKPTPKEAALMSKHVYGGMADSELKGGWKVSNVDFGKNFIKSPSGENDDGFKCQVYEREIAGKTEYCVVFAGTEDGGDWDDNIKQPLGFSSQYDKAIGNAQAVNDKKLNAEITYAGHSLGGGLAIAAALKYDNGAVTFNPAWIAVASIAKYNLTSNWLKSNLTSKIENYVIAGEVLDLTMRTLHTTTGLVVETGKTQYLFNSEMLIPWWNNWASIKSHFIDSVLTEIQDVDSYNQVFNPVTGKYEVDKK